jgi:NhaP-type Na+/H+ or K+/H+ antiporter
MNCRALVLGIQVPLLSRLGFGLNWKDAAVMTWGGVRGALSLALGLMVAKETGYGPDALIMIQNKVCFILLLVRSVILVT